MSSLSKIEKKSVRVCTISFIELWMLYPFGLSVAPYTWTVKDLKKGESMLLAIAFPKEIDPFPAINRPTKKQSGHKISVPKKLLLQEDFFMR